MTEREQERARGRVEIPEAGESAEWMHDPEQYRSRALDRARDKLAVLEAGQNLGSPVGRAWSSVLAAAAILLTSGGLLFFSGVLILVDHLRGTSGDVLFGGGAIVVGLSLMALMVPFWRASKPNTPKRALEGFYKSLGKGHFERAAGHIVDVDLDAFPRYQPRIEKLGRPSGRGFPFNELEAFQEYWTELVRATEWPYCLASISKLRVTTVNEQLCVVDFRLRLVMNTQLYYLLVLVALPLAVIVDLLTRSVVKQDLRKILVKVGDEWHLLSGDWQGVDEFDTSWLPAEVETEASPYRGQ